LFFCGKSPWKPLVQSDSQIIFILQFNNCIEMIVKTSPSIFITISEDIYSHIQYWKQPHILNSMNFLNYSELLKIMYVSTALKGKKKTQPPSVHDKQIQ